MNKTILMASFLVALTFCAAGLGGYYLYLCENRFYLQASGKYVYKIDRRTGRTWALYGSTERLVTAKTAAIESAATRTTTRWIVDRNGRRPYTYRK